MSMQTRRETHHLIDFLFPVALLFVFAFSAVAVILLATDVYRDTAAHSARTYTAETALAYLTEKVHQGDHEGQVEICEFDGCRALRIRQTYEDANYSTYIYAYQGALRELFTKDGVNVSVEDGQSILEISDLTFADLGEGLLSFSCTDTDGLTSRAVVQVRSVSVTQEGGAGL